MKINKSLIIAGYKITEKISVPIASAGLAPEPAYSVAPIMACTNNLGDPGPADTTDPKIYPGHSALRAWVGQTVVRRAVEIKSNERNKPCKTWPEQVFWSQ